MLPQLVDGKRLLVAGCRVSEALIRGRQSLAKSITPNDIDNAVHSALFNWVHSAAQSDVGLVSETERERERQEDHSENHCEADTPRVRARPPAESNPPRTDIVNVCSQHMNWTELNRPATSRPSYTTRSLVTRVSATTWLAAANLWRLVLSQFVRCEQSRWNTRVTVQFSSVHVLWTNSNIAVWEWTGTTNTQRYDNKLTGV